MPTNLKRKDITDMKFFAPLLIVLAFCLVAYLLMILSIKLSNRLASKKIIGRGIKTRDETVALLYAELTATKFVEDFNSPVYIDGIQKNAHADVILVRKNGIFVANICPYRGKIDNEDDFIWRRTANTRHGPVEKTFPSPVVETKHAVAVVRHLLEKSGIDPSMIHGIVIISRLDADTMYEDEGVYRTQDAIKYIKNLNSKFIFERKEFKDISVYLSEKSEERPENEVPSGEKRR